MKIQPPFSIKQSMPNEACFIYLIDGESRIRTAMSEIKNDTREAVLLKCGNYIGDVLPSSGEYEALVVHFSPEVLQKIFKDDYLSQFSSQQQKKVIQSAVIPKDEVLEKYIDSLIFYFRNPALADDELLLLKIKELVMILNKLKYNDVIQHILGSLFDPDEYSFKDIVEQHIYTDISIENLAHLTMRSLSSFKRDFQKYYESAPSRYIKNRKLEQAAKLLVGTDLRISDVVFQSGFTNQSHFGREFSKKFNMNPGAYRLSHSAH